MNVPRVVTEAEWQSARGELLIKGWSIRGICGGFTNTVVSYFGAPGYMYSVWKPEKPIGGRLCLLA
jgi:hypothetical protein